MNYFGYRLSEGGVEISSIERVEAIGGVGVEVGVSFVERAVGDDIEISVKGMGIPPSEAWLVMNWLGKIPRREFRGK